MTKWFRRLYSRIRYRRFDLDLNEELEFHKAMKQAELETAGLSPEEARLRAMRDLGNVAWMREESRAVWIAPWLDGFRQDISYALRSFRKHPSYSVTAALILFLAIGLNTGLFTLFNAFLLRSWPVPDAHRVLLVQARPYGKNASRAISIPEYRYLREHATSFIGLAACSYDAVRMQEGPGGMEEYLQAGFVTSEFFDVLGVGVQSGRGFTRAEDRFGAPAAVAVISDGLWKRRYGADPAVIGRTVGINHIPFTIVGVTARGFEGLDIGSPHYDVWIPLSAVLLTHPSWPAVMVDDPENAYSNCQWIAGRLASGSTPAAATAELDTISRQFRSGWRMEAQGVVLSDTTRIASMSPEQRQRYLPVFGLLFGAVISVLLIACANVSNLQLARAMARHRELGMRMALGAGRVRLIRQLLTECVILCCAAVAPALVLAKVLPQAVVRLVQTDAEITRWLVIDWRVLAFTLGLSLVAVLTSGLAPAIRGTRTLPLASPRQCAGIRASRLRGLLLASQIALTSTLLAAAGLLSHGILRAISADWGFAIDDVKIVRMTLPSGTYRDAGNRAVIDSVAAALETSGHGPAGMCDLEPLTGSALVMPVRLAGESDREARGVPYRPVSADYFRVLDIPLVSGRFYDDRATNNEVVINESFARRFWPGGDALGGTFVDVNAHVSRQVVGIVKDTHIAGLGTVEPMVHSPAGRVARFPSLLVKDKDGSGAAQTRALVKNIDPRINVTIVPLRDNIQLMLKDSILAASLTWAVGLLGLLLAAIGLFGVFAYYVEQRRREIGIRMALGARPGQVVKLILGMARRAALGGLTVGVLLSLLVGQLLRKYLYGLNPLDPAAYALIALVILVAALAATYIPAKRATCVDPTVTLKSE